MTIINLRDVYPFYHSDLFVEVSQDVAEAMTTASRRSGAGFEETGACYAPLYEAF